MNNYTNIMVPLDLTSCSKGVLDVAYSLATIHSAKLNVAHIIAPIPSTWMAYSSLDYIGQVLTENITLYDDEDLIRERLLEICSPYNIDSSSLHLRIGNIEHEINDLANKLNIDLLVMGCHQKEHYDVFTHSTSMHVLKTAKCDLLAVNNRMH